jgi:hypothetical protein
MATTKRPVRSRKDEEGDLNEGAREAEDLRLHFPEGTFKVHLVTNQRVTQELAGEVYAEADRRRIECDRLSGNHES